MKNKKTRLLFTILASGGLIILSGCTIYDLRTSAGTSSNTIVSTPRTSSAEGSSVVASVASSTTSENSSDYSEVSTSLTTRSYGESLGANYLQTTGTQKILVIPVTIKGYESHATSTVLSDIKKTFTGNASDTGWQSLKSFYAASSYGKLSLDITVSDWYACGLTAAQITAKNSSSESSEGPQYVLDNAVQWYKTTYSTNCKSFDQDDDGYIDGVWLVYSAPDYSQVSSLGDTFWAFTTWTDNSDQPNTSSPIADTYCWASYDFMYEGYGTSQVDAHTFIHETGHMMGLEDYYSYKDSTDDAFSAPMGCIDMMDYNIIDHNAYSKFAYGWVNPYKIDHAGTLTLRPSESTGDCAIIPTSGGWNGNAFDEYMMIEYYTPTGLNESDSESNYEGKYPLGFTENGVRIYHVDSRLCVISVSGSNYTYGPYTNSIVSSSTKGTLLANSNTYGEDYMDTIKSPALLQEMDCTGKRNFALTENSLPQGTKASDYYIADDSTLFQDGNSFSFSSYKASFPYGSSNLMNDESTLPFKVSFSNETSSGVTVTIEAA
jgi:M6 family metalloprotease-like protein